MTTQAPAPAHAYAGWFSRALGFFIDILPVIIIHFIAIYFFNDSFRTESASYGGVEYQNVVTSSQGPAFYGLWVLSVIYWYVNKGYFEGTTGKSLGKLVTGKRTVAAQTGEPLGAGKGCLRAFLVWIEFVLIGACIFPGLVLWLWPLWDPENQALLSDKTTHSLVV